MLLFVLACSSQAMADDHDDDGPFVKNSVFSFRMIPRAPEQMIAFYEARGFPKRALDLIKKTCFITAIVRNKDKTVIWTELKNWRFYNDKEEIGRLDRRYWHAKWEELDIPQANRSTFDWTLMPEVRDLQLYEPAGGNVVIPLQQDSFDVEAIFFTGQDKRGNEIRVQFKDVKCPLDNE